MNLRIAKRSFVKVSLKYLEFVDDYFKIYDCTQNYQQLVGYVLEGNYFTSGLTNKDPDWEMKSFLSICDVFAKHCYV